MRRLLLPLIALLWLVLLAIPMGRVNLIEQALHSGSRFPSPAEAGNQFVGMFDDGNLYADNIPWPDSAKLCRDHPDDREVQLGLLGGSKGREAQALDRLMARYPRDPTLIALRLVWSLGRLKMGRRDNPYSNPNWPNPDTGPYAFTEKPSPRSDWERFLALAQTGSALEPNNTFFDWMRMVALIALRRDDEALQVLDHAAPKTGFDEHFAEYRLALLNAVELARPLLPSEILAVGAPTDQVSPMTTVASCVMGRVLVDRQSGRDQLAVTEAYHLLLLGRCYRLHAYSVDDPVFAKSIEDLAIQEVKILPVSGTRPRFARIPPPSLLLSKDDNLAGLAAECGRPVIAREVVAEATALRGQPDLLRQSLRHVPGGGWACAAALQERWGRMLLRTLPACLVLLLCAAAAGRHWRCADATAARSRIQGAVLGGLTLLFLAAGDLGRCWRTQIDALGLISPPYFAKAHGLYALMPMLTAGSIAGVFVLLSLARAHRSQKPVPTIRPWLVTLPSPLALPQFESRPLVRFIALITIWTALICAFFFVCLDGNAVPLGRDDWLFRYADFLALGIWTIFLAWALHDWFHLPDPPGALGQVWRSLRELTAGYLLAALVIYPVTALLILPVDREFEVTYRRAIHTGEAATVRRELGL